MSASTGATPGGLRDRDVTSPPSTREHTRRLSTETKAAFKTTEFWAMVGLIVAILVSAAVINGGDNGTDEFIARQAWLYVAILGAGYFICVAWPSPAAATRTTPTATRRRSSSYSGAALRPGGSSRMKISMTWGGSRMIWL